MEYCSKQFDYDDTFRDRIVDFIVEEIQSN